MGSNKRRLEERLVDADADRISSLPDGVLGDIISLLPTKDGGRTQVLSSRWRHLWRTAPLNLEACVVEPDVYGVPPGTEISRILSSHRGPARRFSISYGNRYSVFSADLAGWLRSPTLDKLQELQIKNFDIRVPEPALHRFSSTLRVATFTSCSFMDDTRDASGGLLHFRLLKQLSLTNVGVSESYLHALLAACPVLQSLLIRRDWGNFPRACPRVQIVSPSLISIGVHSGWKKYGHQVPEVPQVPQLAIKDAPCLERLLLFGGNKIEVLVISAPRLHILGKLRSTNFPRFHSGTKTTTVQGSNIMGSLTAVVSSVKVLAISNVKLCLNVVINLMKCFPHLEKLYIQITRPKVENWFRNEENIGAPDDIRLRKIVLANYHGYKSQVQLAKFFISSSRVLELMRFELAFANVSHKWIEEQHSLLDIEKRASVGAKFDFVRANVLIGSCTLEREVHDLSIMDPFQRIHHLV